MTELWNLFDALLSWRFALSLSIFVALALYSSWLYHMALQDRDADRVQLAAAQAANARLREDVDYLAECLRIDLSYEDGAATEEMPAVKPEPEGPTTVEADAADTFARQEVVLAKHREGSRSVADILAEAGLEPVKRRRW